MIKKITTFLLLAFIICLIQTSVLAVGDGNIDGGGGKMGNGLSKYYWSIGNEGVRITVIRDSDNSAASTPVDFTNKHPDNIKVHFGKVSKVQYRNGVHLAPDTGPYEYSNPMLAMPRIISVNGNVNIAAIKSYFTDLK